MVPNIRHGKNQNGSSHGEYDYGNHNQEPLPENNNQNMSY